MMKSVPNLMEWVKEGKSYVRYDGLRKVVKVNFLWVVYSRKSVDQDWTEGNRYTTLTVAQYAAK